VQGVVGAVRSALANYYANSSTSGTPAYPTLAQLTAAGTVMNDAMARNPYNNSNAVNAAVVADVATRAISGTEGWRYFFDNTAGSQTCTFWCNSSTTTTAANGAGGFLTANNL
jgi:hypothetical protein